MANKKRIEFDSLGSKKIDQNKLWGAQTQRSLENFRIGNEKIPSELIIALGQQKKASAEANIELGVIDKKLGSFISKACNDIINLKLIDEFPLSVWQTGSGTQTNMNANEVISNHIIKKLKGKIGSKKPIHPNDHVNLSQSSNDTFPTIMHVAINELSIKNLIPNLKDLIKEFQKKKKNVLIAAHGNSLRAIMIKVGMYKPEEISSIELHTGSPLCLDYDNGQLNKHYYLD